MFTKELSKKLKNQTIQICRKINKAKGNDQTNNQLSINFEQFKGYFQVIQSPSDRFIFMKQLNRKSSIQEFNRKMKDKNLFPKQKGQKIKINWLVGQKQQKYSSTIDLNFYKHLQTKSEQKAKNQNNCFFKLIISCQSEQNAKELGQILNPVLQMLRQALGAQDQQIAGLLQVVQITISQQQKNTVVLVTTQNEYLKQYLFDNSQFLDNILKTEVTFLFKFHFGFQFEFQNLQKDKTSRIQQILARNNQITFKYEGSQFMNSVKQVFVKLCQLILQFGGFQVLYNVDQYDQETLIYLGMLCTQNVDLNLKFKNVQKKKAWPTQLTNMLSGVFAQLHEFIQQGEQLNLKRIFQLIGSSIKFQGCVKNVRTNCTINIKNLGKIFGMSLPMFQFQDQS